MSMLSQGILGGIAGGADKYNQVIDEQRKMKHDEAKWSAETERSMNLEALKAKNAKALETHKAGLGGKGGMKLGNWHEFIGQAQKRFEGIDPQQLRVEYATAVKEGFTGTQTAWENQYINKMAQEMALAASSYSTNKVSGPQQSGQGQPRKGKVTQADFAKVDQLLQQMGSPEDIEALRGIPELYEYAKSKLGGIKPMGLSTMFDRQTQAQAKQGLLAGTSTLGK